MYGIDEQYFMYVYILSASEKRESVVQTGILIKMTEFAVFCRYNDKFIFDFKTVQFVKG